MHRNQHCLILVEDGLDGNNNNNELQLEKNWPIFSDSSRVKTLKPLFLNARIQNVATAFNIG